MTIFKVGDKARIRKDLKDGEMYDTCTGNSCFCSSAMAQRYRGLSAAIFEKDPNSGFMRLRRMEDGFTTEMPWAWSDDMLELLEEEKPHGFLKAGDAVKVRKDIAKRCDSKNRIWITLNGEKHASYPVSAQIKDAADKTVVITEVLNRPGHMDGYAYRARLAGATSNPNILGTFDITMFDCLPDWLEANKKANPDTANNFKVGDKVVIKTTVSSGERIDNVLIQPFMFEQAFHKGDCTRRKIGIVRRVNDSGKTGDVDFDVKDESVFTWPFKAFDKLDKLPKPNNGKRKKLDSKADYSGYTPKSELYCYDYLNRKATFSRGTMNNITKIEITVMSGDETGCFYGVCNGEPWQYRFDTMACRFTSYDDGSYTVEGRENIEKWINWSCDPEKAIYAEYSMERMRAFKR